MTNRQARRIWWRRKRWASSVLLWRFPNCLGRQRREERRLARGPGGAASVAILRAARSADNAATSYSYSSHMNESQWDGSHGAENTLCALLLGGMPTGVVSAAWG